MNVEKKKQNKAIIFIIFEFIMLISLYYIIGSSIEIGWWWGIPISFFIWFCINIVIAATNDYY